MKKYCFLFVFLVAALSLRAQIVGDVAVTRKAVSYTHLTLPTIRLV